MRYFPCFAVLIGLILAPSEAAQAQSKLKVRHNENKTIVMRYLPRNKFGVQKNFYRVEIPPDSVREITVTGDDPWFVNCYTKDETTTEVQISQEIGQNLTALAMSQPNEPYELQLSFAETRVNGKRRIQTMSASLIDQNGEDFKCFNLRNGREDQEFNDFLARRWETEYEAIDGSTVPATLDFRRQVFITPGWTGRFNGLAVIQGEQLTRVCGRWSTPDGKYSGDVFFTFDTQNPAAMSGTYSVGNDDKLYRWSARE